MKQLLKNKNFRHLWLAQIVSQIAINMMAFVLAIRVYQATYSNTAVSLIFLSIGLPALLFGIPAGVLADYLDRRFILFFSNLSRAVLLLFFFFAAKHVFIIYVLASMTASITQLFIPAEGSLMADLVKKDNLLEANSLFTLSFYSSLALGFIASGPALNFFGRDNIFLFLSFCLFLASYFVYLLPVAKKARSINLGLNFLGKFQKLADNVVETVDLIVKNQTIFFVILLITVTQVIATVFSALVPGFADTILKIKVEEASYLVLGPTIAGVLLGSVFINFFNKKDLGTKQTIAKILFLISIILVSLSYSSFHLTIVLLFGLGLLQSFLLVPAYVAVQKMVATEFRGRVYGIITSFIGGASIFPSLVSGMLADLFGVGRTLQILGLLIALFGYLGFKNKNL